MPIALKNKHCVPLHSTVGVACSPERILLLFPSTNQNLPSSFWKVTFCGKSSIISIILQCKLNMEFNEDVSKVCEIFCISKLSDFQYNAIKKITEKNNDVFINMPTGSCKSLTYHLPGCPDRFDCQKGDHDAKVNKRRIF